MFDFEFADINLTGHVRLLKSICYSLDCMLLVLLRKLYRSMPLFAREWCRVIR